MEWETNTYPEFCYGPIYIMAPNIAFQLLEAFKATLKQHYLWIEDVYITGKTLVLGTLKV